MVVSRLRATCRGGLRCCSIGCAVLGMVGVLTFGCKCARTHEPVAIGRRSVGLLASTPSKDESPTISVDARLASLNRRRRFTEALEVLSHLPPDKLNQPLYRFLRAALSVNTKDDRQALASLQGLEAELPELLPDIEALRARAQLLTADALVGATWLAERGQQDVWLDAARNLVRLGIRPAALTAIERGLSALGPRPSARASAAMAEYRALRVELNGLAGANEDALSDLRWFAVEMPAHVGAQALVRKALDSGSLRLDATQQESRLRHLADAGAVEQLESELASQTKGRSPLTPALIASLRGRARQVARVDQIEGARLLERAADLSASNGSQLRLDAARLYVREGRPQQAVRLYDRVAQRERSRSQEAQFYAARALATLGEPRKANERFTRLIERYPAGRWSRTAELERAQLWLALGAWKRAESKLLQLANDEKVREQRPLLLQLAGLAGLHSGQEAVAIERWQEVIAEAPLSLSAAFARARLRELGVSSQPPTPPAAPVASPAPVNLSRRIKHLLGLGLEEMAADVLRKQETELAKQQSLSIAEFACRAWGRVGFGERRYRWSRSVRDLVDLTKPLTEERRWTWNCRFPRPYEALVQEFEAGYRLPGYLLSAVMRQESGFDPNVQSPAGAVGLLQLLPQTASRVAEEFRIAGEIVLAEPRTNLQLGGAYLRKLLDLFDENLVLAVAAYNAGPQAVALWHRHAGASAVELFAARIPYAETQKYVERVLGNLVVYRYLNGSGPELEGLSLSLPKELKVSGPLY